MSKWQLPPSAKKFYLKASRESGNELGKKLLQWLAQEEEHKEEALFIGLQR